MECLEELGINSIIINYEEYCKQLKKEYNIEENIIVLIVDFYNEVFFYFYNPYTGKELYNSSIPIYNENSFTDYYYNIIKSNNNSINTDEVINYLRNDLVNGSLATSILNYIEKENKDLIIKDNNIIYQITSSYNQIFNEYDNTSSINLGECETKLRFTYNISNNITLLILKIDIYEKGLLIPIIEYEVYDSETKKKLNLDVCKDTKIEVSIPVNIDENILFKYDSSNEYYNDICYSYASNNTDIILNDRRDEFINNNLSLCESNCKYNKYDFNTKKVSCECNVKLELPLISEIEINKDKLLSNFIDIKNILNINVLKCYKEAFTKKELIFNLGNYIMSSIILITLFLSILFKIKGYINLKKRINSIIKNNKKHKNNIVNNKKKIIIHLKIKDKKEEPIKS